MTSYTLLFDAIKNAYDASTTLRAKLTGGIHNLCAPPEQELPYAVFSLVNFMPADTLNERYDEYLIQVNIVTFVEMSEGGDLDDLLSIADALNTVIRTDTAGTGALTITGYTHHFTQLESYNLFPSDTPDIWQWSGRYRILMQKN